MQRDNAVNNPTLYERLGGYDAITAVANDLLPGLQADARLGRYWQNRGEDGIRRDSNAGGPMYYTGRDMQTSHKGMKISEDDWAAFMGHLHATLETFKVPQAEYGEVIAFVESTKAGMAEE